MNAAVRQVKIINPTVGIEANKVQRIAAYCRVSTDSEDQANSFLAQIKVNFKEIANLILTCASDKYDCCHIQRNRELSKALLPEYVPLLNEETLEPKMVEGVIEKIIVYPNGNIKLRLVSGEEITEEVESNECSTDKNSNED